MQVKLSGVKADYQLGPIRSPLVLNGVDLTLSSGSLTAVVGHTGAGKSSLLKMLNGLLLPTEGEVQVGDATIKPNHSKKALKEIRKKVGMVFQFPESQLFAETVEKDISFGPLNFGFSRDEVLKRAYEAAMQVGIDPEGGMMEKSPFTLSGGQKRRVAIAGILAMDPDILVLDEPGAGLDPAGKKEILTLIQSWHKTRNLTTILVTHDMEDVVRYADNVVVMEKGKVVMHDTVYNVFADVEKLAEWHLDLPDARRLQLKIEHETGKQLPGVCLTPEELADALIEVGLV
ncbi:MULTISPECIES: energy-coupling factor transporter ATPase [Bacillaceae]|uniref:Energy-coupling factor transporter ATP-binding protein EcfA2 n=1 Tax=Evansella alkalicola TaxID=745819 RepID=A0ABS6JTB1_9BACI|nr:MULTISPECIES: energy-coupling factor transporter ATPase [Bacillaceae]MBU9721660.1 energy-coupling factor transporter ATPase [Bacillus alkalicola]